MRLKPSELLKHCAIGLVVGIWALSAVRTQHASGKVDFRRDVEPILKQFCIECHGSSQQMHGFRLDRRRDAMRGGMTIDIIPGSSESSRLYLKLLSNKYGPQMPPTGPLAEEQTEIIKAWIDQGAEWPDDLSGETPASPPDARAALIMRALREGDGAEQRQEQPARQYA